MDYKWWMQRHIFADESIRMQLVIPAARIDALVIFSRETRADLVFMIEAKFSPAGAAELRPGQPVDVEVRW